MQQQNMNHNEISLPLENQAHRAQIQQVLSEEQQTMDLAICERFVEKSGRKLK